MASKRPMHHPKSRELFGDRGINAIAVLKTVHLETETSGHRKVSLYAEITLDWQEQVGTGQNTGRTGQSDNMASTAVRRMLALSRENSEEVDVPQSPAKEQQHLKEPQQDDPRPCGPIAVNSSQTPAKASPMVVPDSGPLSPSISPEVLRALAALQDKERSPEGFGGPETQRGRAHSIAGRASSVEDVLAIEQVLQKSLSRLDELEGSKNRFDKWKNEAIQHGLKMVEEERTRGQVEREILLRRISFLSEELEETKANLEAKRRDYEDLMEAAQEISVTASHADGFDRDFDTHSERSFVPQSILSSPEPVPKHWINQSPMHSSEKSSKGMRICSLGVPFCSPSKWFW